MTDLFDDFEPATSSEQEARSSLGREVLDALESFGVAGTIGDAASPRAAPGAVVWISRDKRVDGSGVVVAWSLPGAAVDAAADAIACGNLTAPELRRNGVIREAGRALILELLRAAGFQVEPSTTEGVVHGIDVFGRSAGTRD